MICPYSEMNFASSKKKSVGKCWRNDVNAVKRVKWMIWLSLIFNAWISVHFTIVRSLFHREKPDTLLLILNCSSRCIKNRQKRHPIKNWGSMEYGMSITNAQLRVQLIYWEILPLVFIADVLILPALCLLFLNIWIKFGHD